MNPTDYNFWVEELYNWQYRLTGSFCNMLTILFRKADMENKHRLDAVYPGIFEAMQAWENAGDNGNALFREHGLFEKYPPG